MARLAGVDLPGNKRVEISLTYIYGIGRTSAKKILKDAKLESSMRMQDLDDSQVASLKDIIEKNYTVEGDLRSRVALDIKRLMDIACYKGIRHRRGLPVNGQRTKTNAKTRKKRKTGTGMKRN